MCKDYFFTYLPNKWLSNYLSTQTTGLFINLFTDYRTIYLPVYRLQDYISTYLQTTWLYIYLSSDYRTIYLPIYTDYRTIYLPVYADYSTLYLPVYAGYMTIYLPVYADYRTTRLCSWIICICSTGNSYPICQTLNNKQIKLNKK